MLRSIVEEIALIEGLEPLAAGFATPLVFEPLHAC
jgi:hypothetical protein